MAPTDLGIYLVQEMDRANLSPHELSERAGMPPIRLSRLIADDRARPSQDACRRLAEVLGVPVQTLGVLAGCLRVEDQDLVIE